MLVKPPFYPRRLDFNFPVVPPRRQTIRPPGKAVFGKKKSFSSNDLASLRTNGFLTDGPNYNFAEEGLVIDESEEDRPKRVLFVCHGSRGDVQPLISLAVGMRAKGYNVAFFAVHPVNQLVDRHGFKCYDYDLDIEVMMRRVQSVTHSLPALSPSIGFFYATVQTLRDDEFKEKVDAIPDKVLEAHLDFRPDLTITSHCMPAISCAEKLHIPVIYIALQPMYPTSNFPPFAFSPKRFGRRFSWLHKPLGHMFMSVYEKSTYMSGVTRCRELAGLNPSQFQDGTPVYNLRFVPTCTVISQALVPQPDDWPRWQKITGFLLSQKGGEEAEWVPPPPLVEFLEDGTAPVYIGFGSMCSDEDFAVKLTRLCIQSLQNNNFRGIMLGGWAGMTRKRLDEDLDSELIEYAKENVFEMASCPHSWLFPRCSSVVHHGGAGTLAAGLSAGRPMVICPFIFDQQYFGGLVGDKGCGVVTSPAKDLTLQELTEAILKVTSDAQMSVAAGAVGQEMMLEDGVSKTIDFIEEVTASFPYPWKIKCHDYTRAEPKWTDKAFAHVFSGSRFLDSDN
uniref:Erythromycin biosynthesis protein CIII-like C-terminal domain-containing protein n=1 Tax=Octactis speculum TaxID=3111310 RepID=A0A7S2HR29_9STRA|mmetsp:Transcript_8695/g.11011  ORF Transcript_8695/g.11011 Transcript_8695/m.11011 type:complete len:562 (+) Transcript_8695:31-1716(+)